MTWFEILLLALSLCIDTFAVSMSGSQSIRRASFARLCLIVCTFSFFQAGLALVGWIGGLSLHKLITSIDHWIAFVLLLYIGVKMIAEGAGNIRRAGSGEETSCRVNLLSVKTLLLSAVATSIDALAVGITLAIVDLPPLKLWGGIVLIALVTMLASLAGVFSGKWLGKRFGDWAQAGGGVVLIVIGIKILAEHTVFA